MKRPWQIWLSFAVCLVVVLAAMGWISQMALRAEADRQRFVTLEENVRLALWRMDSALAPVVAQESARPPAVYAAVGPANTTVGLPPGGVALVPSPLLTERPLYVLLHYQIDAHGRVSSPQAPDEDVPELLPTTHISPDDLATARRRLTALGDSVDYAQWAARLPAPSESWSAPAMVARSESQPPNGPAQVQQRANPYANQAFQGNMPQAAQAMDVQRNPRQAESIAGKQRSRATQEFNFRSQAVQLSADSYLGNNALAFPELTNNDRIGPMSPFWEGDRLHLARRVRLSGQHLIQGCQLNWPALESSLLESVADLFPHAKLERTVPADVFDASRLLAALPVRFVPGEMASSTETSSALLLPLSIAWSGVLLAAAAVAALLLGVVRLSERRGAFVSAVTHELRTPLTTFRMYAEMLAEDMVPDAEKRRGYLETLRAEADRLSHLVENVLSYARLERCDTRGRISNVPVSQLLDRVGQRLSDRAAQAGLAFSVVTANGAARLQARTDASAVEQILFNLVDNACKYAADSDPPRIQLEVDGATTSVVFRVRDHGAGISPSEGRRLFRPFSKSAQQAAHTAPGVGLGLALSRRLARDTGGNLELESPGGQGACFVLTLPRAAV